MQTPFDPISTDPFVTVDSSGAESADFAALTRRPTMSGGRASPTPSPFGVTLARLVGFDWLEQPLVSYPMHGVDHVLPARTTVKLQHAMKGAQVLVAHENAQLDQPVVIGLINPPQSASEPTPPPAVQALVDGERQVITAEREIVLRCGDASITLTRAGKVIIKGTYILSRASGYNRIKGAAIDLN